MKFAAKTTEQGCIEAFSKLVTTVAKLSKLCILRITATHLFFIQNENLKEHAHKLWLEITAGEFFEEFRMEGFSPEANEIYLELHPDELMRALRSHGRTVRLRLTKKGTPPHPHLTVEIKHQMSASGNPTMVTHDIPVQVIHERTWTEYPPPVLPRARVGVVLPVLKTIYKIVSSFRSINPKHLVMMANNEGALRLETDTDIADVSTIFTDLRNLDLDEEFRPPPMDKNRLQEFFSVRVDIKTLTHFLSNQQLNFCRLSLYIVHHRLAYLVIDEDEFKLQYFIPGVTL